MNTASPGNRAHSITRIAGGLPVGDTSIADLAKEVAKLTREAGERVDELISELKISE